MGNFAETLNLGKRTLPPPPPPPAGPEPCIRQRSDYITGFVTLAIGPNKSEKLTRLIAPAHNIRGKV